MRACFLAVFLLSISACGDDDRPGSDASADDAAVDVTRVDAPFDAVADDAASPIALGPQAVAHRARCESYCDGKGDPSNACEGEYRETCIVACQSRLALVDTPCATCILDEAFIEDSSERSCRYFFLEQKATESCSALCSGSSELAQRDDRVARCRGFCSADAYGTRCVDGPLDECTTACMGRTELLTTSCATCLIDEFNAEHLDAGQCRYFFDEISVDACGTACDAESSTPTEDLLTARCAHFCSGNGGGYSDGCPAAESERCMSACRARVDGLNSGCAACVLDHGFIEELDAESCRFSFAEVADPDCVSFCAP